MPMQKDTNARMKYGRWMKLKSIENWKGKLVLVEVVAFVDRVTGGMQCELRGQRSDSRTAQWTARTTAMDGRIDWMEGRMVRGFENVSRRAESTTKVVCRRWMGKPQSKRRAAVDHGVISALLKRRMGMHRVARFPPASLVSIPLTAIVDLDARRFLSLA